MTAARPRPRAKLKPGQLGARIEREGLERLYLIAGDEPYQCLEAMDHIRSQARALGVTERVVLEAQAGFDWQRLRYEANHLSLFSDRRLIELTLAHVPPNSEGVQTIIAYAQGMSADTVVVIRAPVLDYRAKQGAWYQAIEAAGVIVEVAPVPPEAMPDWILRLGERRGLILDQEAAMFIAERVENNLPAASQELEKLRLSLPGGKAGLEDVVAVVADSSRYDVFALVNCVLAGRLARSLSVLAGLRAEGTEAALVTWSLVRELRILCRLAYNQARKLPLEPLFEEFRVWDRRKAALKPALRRHTVASLRELLLAAHQVERAIKGAIPGDPWLMLSEVAIGLAGGAAQRRVDLQREGVT